MTTTARADAVRETPVGLIPADWEVTTIGDEFEVIAGGDWDPANSTRIRDQAHPYPVVANALGPDAVQGYCSYFTVRGDSLTITGRGDVGKAVYRSQSFVPIVRLLALVPKRGSSAKFFTEYINSLASFSLESTGVPQLTAPQVRPYLIARPPNMEQRAIASALTDTDELIALLGRLISKKRAVKKAIMQQLLIGKTRLPGFTSVWRSCRLSEMLSYEQPGRFLVRTDKQLERGRVPVLTAGKTFVLGYTNESDGVYTAHPVIIFDDFTTASKFVDFDFKAKSSAMKILSARPGTNLRFIYERMQLIDFPLGDHKRYWISEYAQQTVEVPDEAEQHAIAAVLADVDNELNALRLRLLKAKAVKQGMMQELLTGHTRLPVEVAA